MKLLDTNILLDYSDLLFENYNKEYVIHIATLEEIDNIINGSLSEEKKFKARQARNKIKQAKQELIKYSLHSPIYELPSGINYDKVDNILLGVCKDLNYCLVTNDIAMQVKAEAIGVQWEEVNENNDKEIFTGIREIFISEQGYVDLMGGLYKESYSLYPNEYLIINNTTNNDQYLLMWNGEYFEEVKIKPITNKYINKINPLDIYQRAFIHMLQNDDVKIKITDSPFGCGKSFLMIHWSLQMIEKGKYDKLIFIKSDTPPKYRKDFPAIPGNINEKCEPLMGLFCDITSEDNFTDILLRNQTLEILPIQFARGRSLKNSVVIINEAQNFTPSEMEILISRIGENSVVLIDGSNQQIDNRNCFRKSGLKAVIENFKEEKIAAQVNMINDYRSELSKLVGSKDWSDK